MISAIENVIAAFAASGSLIFAAISVRKAIVAERVVKTVDVTMHCSERYDILLTTWAKLREGDLTIETARPELIDYYRRFWGLKSDQFDYWLYGVLDHDTFYDWSYSLLLNFISNKEMDIDVNQKKPVISLIESWSHWRNMDERVNRGGSNPRFEEFTQSIFELAEEYVEQICHKSTKRGSFSLPKRLLNIISELEGTEKMQGFSRQWRNRIWRGMDFSYFKFQMLEDINKIENGHEKKAAG